MCSLQVLAVSEVDLYALQHEVLPKEKGMSVILFYNSDINNYRPLLEQLEYAEQNLHDVEIKYYKTDVILYSRSRYYRGKPTLVITYGRRPLAEVDFVWPQKKTFVTFLIMVKIKIEKMLLEKKI